jgi:PhnO protein
MVTIRDAGPDDAARLMPLLEALGYPAAADAIGERLRALLSTDPGARVLVAAIDGELVGFATLHSTPVLHRATPVGRITGIAVRPSARGAGVGRELVRAAESHFREQGFQRIEVTSGPMHEDAYPFYRRLGYTDQGVRFAKPLDDLR